MEVVKKEKFARVQFPQLHPMNDKQKDLLDALSHESLIIASGSAGTGKAQPLYSKILTKEGWKEMREIQVGDIVRSTDSWTKVTGVFPQGQKQVVRFKFADGAEVDSCVDHLWTVNDNTGVSYRKSKATTKTITTSEIIEILENKKYGNITVNAVEPIALPQANLPIDPYVLGALIGDGCITQTVAITSTDSEILNRIKSSIDDLTLTKNPSTITYYFNDPKANCKNENRMKTALRDLNLLGCYSQNKFIPDKYKNCSIEQRYALVQGLMDTDGTVDSRNGNTSYCTTSPKLASDLRELILSLGGKSSVSTAVKHFTYKGEKKVGLKAYIVSISVPDKKKLFYLSRKKELVANTDTSQLRRVVTSFEYLGEMETQCISVDHPTHLYVTDDYVLTHNTLLSCWHAAKKLHHRDIDKVVLLRAYQPLAGRSIGFLPGELESKLIPFYQQMLDYFEDYLGKASTEIHIKNKTIEICSLETIRGRSWDNAIIIVDEAQSLFVPEVQALVTRVGKNSQLIFCGDDSGVQTDVKNGMDGLTYLKKLIEKYRISDTKTITFTRDHIVRSGLTKEFVIAFEDEIQDDAIGMAIVSTKEINSQFKKPR
jgi:phosphate starvation-inducible protein PhoH